MDVKKSILIAELILPDARMWLRKTSENLNQEIRQTTAACLLDLKNAGVITYTDDDPLIHQACKLYLKAQFGFNDDSEKWEKAYEHLKSALSLCSDYTTPAAEVSDNG